MSTSFTAMTWNVENLFPPGHLISAHKAVSEEEYNCQTGVPGADHPDHSTRRAGAARDRRQRVERCSSAG